MFSRWLCSCELSHRNWWSNTEHTHSICEVMSSPLQSSGHSRLPLRRNCTCLQPVDPVEESTAAVKIHQRVPWNCYQHAVCIGKNLAMPYVSQHRGEDIIYCNTLRYWVCGLFCAIVGFSDYQVSSLPQNQLIITDRGEGAALLL